MLRRLLEYVFVKAHIIEGRTQRDTLEIIKELLPCIVGVTIILAAMRQFGYQYRPPWYKRLWRMMKIKVRYARWAVVGW